MLSFFKKHYFYFFYFSVVRIRLSQELNLKTKTKHTNKNRNTDRDHTEGYQWGGQGGRMGEKAQGKKSINRRYKIDRGRLRIVWEMEKPKNLHVRPMDMN